MPADSLTAAVYSLLTASGWTAREPWGMGGMICGDRPTLMGLTALMALSTSLLHVLP